MRPIVIAFYVGVFAGCSTANPNPGATPVVYEQVKQGIENNHIYSHRQIYALLGQPYSVDPPGDIDHCRTATWKIPHGTHGWGHFTVSFSGDIAVHYDAAQAIARVWRDVTLDDIIKMQSFDATVERTDISHPFFVWTAADIYLARVDNGKGLDLQFVPANKNVINFIHSLHDGERYTFPQVLVDYMNNHPTNAVKQ